MKKVFFVCLGLICFLGSCTDSSSDDRLLSISPSTITVDYDDTTLTIEVTSAAEWNVQSNSSQWCTPRTTAGSSQGKLVIDLSENLDFADRKAVITVTSGKVRRECKITQKANPTVNPNAYIYKLPVIFHVLYTDPNNTNQYPNANRFKELIDQCNKLYQARMGTHSSNMGLEFVLATKSPTGYTLPTPGVEYIEWQNPVMDAYEFMMNKNKNTAYTKLLWDLDNYINIMVYTFSEENVLGISHLPYSLNTSLLEGLSGVKYTPQTSNLTYPHCVSINNSYIHKSSTSGLHNSRDAVVTLAHELGHYLGLFHVFSEEEGEFCRDTDFCEDTPTYDKAAYESWVDEYIRNNQSLWFEDLVKRTSCSGVDFVSRNLMDYAISYSDQFTPNQVSRVRHVLHMSPLIPGPKKKTKTRSVTLEGPQDLPVRVIE